VSIAKCLKTIKKFDEQQASRGGGGANKRNKQKIKIK
jgi:hypothetical protein